MNVGVLLGTDIQEGYLAVIDCDIKSTKQRHLKEMEAYLNTLGIDLTMAPTVMSGRGNGSRHIYIRTAKPLRPHRMTQSSEKVEVYMPSAKPTPYMLETLGPKKVGRGIRLRPAWEVSAMGVGQQVVLPPSIHPDSGLPYEWAMPFESIDDLEFFTAKEGAGHKREVLEDFKVESVDIISSDLPDDIVAGILEGDGVDDRSSYLFKAAMAMVKVGFTNNQILTVLTDRSTYLGMAGYEHAQTNSRARAAKWVHRYTLAKGRTQADPTLAFSDDVPDAPPRLEPAKAAAQAAAEAGSWKIEIERTDPKDPQSPPKNTFKNIKLILTESAGERFIALNEFSVEDVWQCDTPWGSQRHHVATDKDPIKIKNWLAHQFRMEPSVEKIEEVLVFLADRERFHPVREYLDGLEWDGVARLDTWLKDYLHADGPKKYLAAVGTKTLVAMVKRIYEPGCKFDNVLILEGTQGIGKSSTASILAKPWFSDTTLNIGDKDAVVNMQGVWVYEMGELSAMSRFETNALKEFISRSTDKIRPPYGKRSIQFPRQSVFIGTTNQDEYLKDRTGNRRYWPVKVHGLERDALIADRDQLLAEAVVAYQLGEEIYMDDPALVSVVMRQQGERVETDLMDEVVADFLANAPEDFDVNKFSTNDVFKQLEVRGVRNDRGTQMRVANALKHAGYIKARRRGEASNRHYMWFKDPAQAGF